MQLFAWEDPWLPQGIEERVKERGGRFPPEGSSIWDILVLNALGQRYGSSGKHGDSDVLAMDVRAGDRTLCHRCSKLGALGHNPMGINQVTNADLEITPS